MIVDKNNSRYQQEQDLDSLLLDEIPICDTSFPQITTDLKILNEAHNYREWLYCLMKGVLGKRILEIGSGLGNYTCFLLKHGTVWATDVENSYVDFLTKKFSIYKNCRVDTLKLDVWDEETCSNVRKFHPDTIVCLNVLEHVKHDDTVVQTMMDCLDIGGHLVLIVPALPILYCDLDKCYGHYRRYKKQDAYRLIREYANAKVIRCQYFNMVGIVGWLFNHILLKKKHLSPNHVRLFDKFVPFISLIERIIAAPIGLSLIIWIRRVR